MTLTIDENDKCEENKNKYEKTIHKFFVRHYFCTYWNRARNDIKPCVCRFINLLLMMNQLYLYFHARVDHENDEQKENLFILVCAQKRRMFILSWFSAHADEDVKD